MDADSTTPESPSSADGNKPDLHQSPPPSAFSASRRTFRRNGLRSQASQVFERQPVVPPNPGTSQPTPRLQRRPTQKMSLFNLFSRAKAERESDYTEQDLHAPPPDTLIPPTPPIPSAFTSPNPESMANVRPPSASREDPQRVPSATSQQNNVSKSPFESKLPGPAISAHRDIATWDTPPLFQAVAKSTIQALLDCPNPNSISQPPKARKSGAAQRLSVETRSRDSAEETRSIETKHTAKAGFSRNSSSSAEELPRKIFVLLKSGYLLQYSEIGPSERFPEKVLQLGMESAAFASDRIAGRHHVIQVFQAADSNGASVASTGSFFSRLGKRTATAKRTIPSMLLLMPNGREMDSWILAIRETIESMGGPKARPDTADTTVRPTTGESLAVVAETKEPPIDSDASQEKLVETRDISPIAPSRIAPSPTEPASPRHSMTDTEDDRAETNTIDDIEELAGDLDDKSPAKKGREESDLFSFASTTATSIDQNPKSSWRDSQRRSDASAATLATTVGTPSLTPLTGSPLFEELLSGTFKTPTDTMSSQIGRRLSPSQSRLSRDQTLPTFDVLAQVQENAETKTVRTSGGDGFKPLLLPPMRSSMATASSPDLRMLAEVTSKHDSKMPMPPLPARDDNGKLDSALPSLPVHTRWPSDSSLDTSMFPTPVVGTNPASPPQRLSLQQSPRVQDAEREKRRSRAFNMPMKINPSQTLSGHPQRVSSRFSHLFGEDELRSPVPVVHTLTAKVGGEGKPDPSLDPRHRPLAVSASSTKSNYPIRVAQHNTSTRPLVLNAGIPPPLPSPLLSISPMLAGSNDTSPVPSPATIQGRTPSLRRPPSIRVSSNHAPFLQSYRTSTNHLPGQAPRVHTTPPIRPLRSSKSSPHISHSSPNLSSLDEFPMPSPYPTTVRDGGLHMTPQMHRTPSPLLHSSTASTPRTPGRRVRSTRGLPELDFGIPVVGLGPPAPPPSAPLPLPPQMGSRNVSPMSTTMPSPGTTGIPNGLGIRI